MVRIRGVNVSLVVLLCLTLLPVTASAQTATAGAIAGGVRDATGALLPGVTVEASSPALIEKVRSAVTDGQGLYKIVDLRPGTYTVTFTLPGFSTLKREGLELTAGFTMTVNAEMRVGGLAETITVSGQTPVVDVQNVGQRRSITRDIIDALPTGRTFQTLAVLIPGVSSLALSTAVGTPQDVGGLSGERWMLLVSHGSKGPEMPLRFDGMSFSNMNSTGGGFNTNYMINVGAVQEMAVSLSGQSAELAVSGVLVNIIPKEGGNSFGGSIFGSFSNDKFQSDNLTDAIKTRGLTAVGALDHIWDFNPTLGGPVIKDKLWFFTAFRDWGATTTIAGLYYNATPTGWKYTPDFSRQAIDDNHYRSTSGRLTWQVTPRNKVNVFYDWQDKTFNHWPACGATLCSPEATNVYYQKPNYLTQATWSWPVTNKLLFEAGITFHNNTAQQDTQPESRDIVAALEQSTNIGIRASPSNYIPAHFNRQWNNRVSVSYVTGSHAFKVGLQDQWGERLYGFSTNQAYSVALLNGAPVSLTQYARPYADLERLKAALGLYAQDQWTIKRFTLNLGVRFDYHNAYVPEQHLEAVRFVGARDFAPVYDVPNWKDLSPRLGVSWDLFGNGKTALKANIARYVSSETLGVATANNQINTSVNQAARTWTDANGDFVPDCDLRSTAANLECGALSPSNFGQLNIVTRYADDVIHGFGVRPNNWEWSVGLQQELRSGVAVDATFVRHWYGNFQVTDNLAVTPADFSPYCITAPVDSRLPGGGGNQACGLYDINPNRFGQVNNLVTQSSHYGMQGEVYTGGDVNFTARLPRGVLLSGGFSTGHTVTDTCYAIDTLPRSGFCHIAPPFQTQVKASGTYPLPWWNLQISATFQSTPGPQITASYVATNAEIAPSLGRNLAAGVRGTATIDLIPSGTRYEDRVNQVDFRLGKSVKLGRSRVQGFVDGYNLFNASPILSLNTRYGPAWLRPTQILAGRMVKVGAQLTF